MHGIDHDGMTVSQTQCIFSTQVVGYLHKFLKFLKEKKIVVVECICISSQCTGSFMASKRSKTPLGVC